MTLTEDGDKRTFTMPEGAVTVTAAFKQSVFPITVTQPQNGTVTADKQTAEIGETVTLTVTPAAHFFLSYIGADVLHAPRTVADIATVMGDGRLHDDEEHTYNLSAKEGRLYVGDWENPAEIDPNLPVTVVDGKFVVETANGDRLTFTLDEEGQITAVTLAYNGGPTVELAEGRSEGYCIQDVYLYSDDEDYATCTFTMPEGAVTVTAVFEAIAYPITVAETENGTVTADKETAKAGDTVTLTVTPAEGFTLDTLTAHTGKVETVADIVAAMGNAQFTNTNGDTIAVKETNLRIEFQDESKLGMDADAPVQYLGGGYGIRMEGTEYLRVTVDENGKIVKIALPFKEVECTGMSDNALVTPLTLTPDTEDSTKCTFTMPQEAVTVTAVFEEPVEPAYYVLGSFNNWEVAEDYKLTASEVEGQYVLTDVALDAGVSVRVVLSEDGIAKNTWYPDGFDNLELSQAGTYDIYFRPDGQGGNGWFGGCIYAEKQAEPVASVAVDGTEEAVNYTSLQEALAAWGENAVLKLLADVTISERITVSGEKALDLNGYGIKMTGADCVIYIADNASLTLRDSNPERTNTGDNRPEGVVGGYITGGNADGTVSAFGGGVRMGMRAGFNMQGGTITGNTCQKSGAGLYLNEGSTFEMTGGYITDNWATTNGGGVCSYKGGVVISGGTISNNHANGEGGGVVSDTGFFNLASGTISNNDANDVGGGVYIREGSLFMQGGSITGNSADEGTGGGIYANDAQVVMTGGSITGNTAANGGGVFFDSEYELSVGGAANITGNTGEDVVLLSLKTGRIAVVDTLANGAAFGVVLKNASGEPVSGTVVKQGGDALTEADLNKFTCAAENASLRLQDGDIFQSVSYAITIPEMENGTVTADKQEAEAGDTVTLTVTPAEGYQLKDGKLYLAHEKAAQMAELVIKSYDEVVQMLKEGYVNLSGATTSTNVAEFVSDTNTTKVALLTTNGSETTLMPPEQITAMGFGAYTEEELKSVQWLLSEAMTEVNVYVFVDAASVMLEATQDAQDASKYTAAMPPFAVTIMAEFEEAATEPAEPVTLIDYPTSQNGITLHGSASIGEVKIHENADLVAALKLMITHGDSVANAIELKVEGGFKAGDVVTIAGVYNNSAEKNTTVDLYTFDGAKANVLFTAAPFINGRTVTTDPVPETYTLTADADALYLGRSGETNNYIILLTVVRPGDASEPAAKYPITVAEAQNGAVTADVDTAKAGDTVTLTVTPDNGYALSTLTAKAVQAPQTVDDIAKVLGSGDLKDTLGMRRVFTIWGALKLDDENQELLTTFASDLPVTVDDGKYVIESGNIRLTFSVDEEGAITGAILAYDGSFTATLSGQSEGTLQQAVTLTQDTEDTSKYTFTMPEGAVTVTAAFKQSVFPITVTQAQNGTVTADKQTAEIGDTVTLTVTPADGYTLDTLTAEAFVAPQTVADIVSVLGNGSVHDEDFTYEVHASGESLIADDHGHVYYPEFEPTLPVSVDDGKYVIENGDGDRVTFTVDEEGKINGATVAFHSGTTVGLFGRSDNSFVQELPLTPDTEDSSKYTFTMPIGAVTVTAAFKQSTFPVAVTAPVGATLTVDGQPVTLDDNGEATLNLTAGEHSYSASKEGFVSLENVAFTVSDTWPNTLMVALELPPADLTEIEVWELGQTLDVGNAYFHQFDDNKAHCGGNVTLSHGGYANGRHQFRLTMAGIGSYSIYIADQDGSLPLGIKWSSGTGTQADPYVFTVVHRELVLQSSDVSAKTSTDIQLNGTEAHQYIIVEKGAEITAESWENCLTPDEYDSVLFENLTPATFYDIYARIQGGTATRSITVVTLISSTEMAGEGDLVGATVSVEGDPARNYTYKWYRDTITTEGGLEQHSLTEISGATSDSYVIAAADAGYDLVVKLFLEGEEMAQMSYGTVGYGTVTFNTNGGSAVESQTGKVYGDKVTKPADPTREGYALLGWYQDEDFTEAWDFDTDTLCWRETTLYAKWEELPELSDDDLAAWTQDGVQIHGVNGQEYIIVEKGTEITDESWAEAKTPDGDGFVTFTQLAAATGYDIYARNVGGVGTRKITVYTSLEGLGLDYDGDLVGVTLTAQPDPAERAYTYQWYYDEITTVNEAQQHNLTEIQGATNASYTTTDADEGKNFRVKVFLDGVELEYADYGPVSRGTVTFNTNGGSAVESQTGKAYGDKVTKPEDPTKDEAAFEGWFTDEDFTEAWDFDTDTLAWADTTLYAKWKSLSHGVVLGVKTTLTSPIEGVKYQWEHLRPGQTKWYKATGNYRQKTYTFTPKMNNEGYIYKCKVTLADGSVVYTEDMYIHVLAIAPTVTLSPDSTTSAIVSSTATLHAEGEDYASFRWQVQKPGSSKWSNTGSSNKDLVVKATKKNNGYKYRCAFINPTGTVYSEVTELVVEMVAPKITAQPEDVTAAAKAKVTFTVEAEGAQKYVWYYQAPGTDTWKKASGGSRATLKVSVKANMNGNKYRCEVTNDAGTTITDAATLTVE